DGLSLRVHADVFDSRQVDDQGIVSNAEASRVVAAAANGDEHLVLPTPVHGRDDVGDIRAVRDQPGTPVDHRVVNLAVGIVAWVARLDDGTAEAGFQGSNRGFTQHSGLQGEEPVEL